MAEDPAVPEFDFPERGQEAPLRPAPDPAPQPAAAAAEPEPHPPAAEPEPHPPAAEPEPETPAGDPETGFLSPQPRRRRVESVLVRVVATAGIVGISTAVAAVLGTLDVAGWMIGLVVSLLSVILAALLWRSRML
jgi:hypothetical protein